MVWCLRRTGGWGRRRRRTKRLPGPFNAEAKAVMGLGAIVGVVSFLGMASTTLLSRTSEVRDAVRAGLASVDLGGFIHIPGARRCGERSRPASPSLLRSHLFSTD